VACVSGSLCGLQAGAASREDEDRLLQGCEPTRRLSCHCVRLPGLPVPCPEDDVDERRQAYLRAQLSTRCQPEGAEAHRPDSSGLGASSPQRLIPEGAGGDAQLVHPRLDRLLRPLLQDAVASHPEEDRRLCHSMGAPQVQADASSAPGRERLVRSLSSGEPASLCALGIMSWQRPSIGSRVNREVHARFWERLGGAIPPGRLDRHCRPFKEHPFLLRDFPAAYVATWSRSPEGTSRRIRERPPWRCVHSVPLGWRLEIQGRV
jgi:hypothetical protein